MYRIMIITILDANFSQTNQPKLLRVNDFSFKKEFYRKSRYQIKRQEYDSYIVNTDGIFLTGLLPKIIQYCRDNNINYEVTTNPKAPQSIIPQEISPLFELREDQKTCVQAALNTDRGVIKAPTGSGKTVLIAAIISTFPEARILFLCHTLSLLKQTQKEFNKYDIGPSSIIGGSKKDIDGRIVISTVQSFSKPTLLDNFYDKFDVVFIDEAHHCRTTSGLYARVLTKLTVSRRYGTTATMPTDQEGLLALEGLIGPKIAELTIEDAIEKEILAIPHIELIPVPFCEAIRDIRKYADTKMKDDYGKFILDENGENIIESGIYTTAIVEYRKRNRLIIEKAIEKNKIGESVLIYIINIDHGERLMQIAKLMGMNPIFIRGSSDSELREKTRQALNNKEILTTIATVAWAEGVNIRNLDCILLAGGGKSITALIQKIGRGLRRTETKTKATIIDCLDSGRYISEHCIERLKVYAEKGWL